MKHFPRKSNPPKSSPFRQPASGQKRPAPQNRGDKHHERASKIRIDLYGHHATRAAILNPNRIIHAIYATKDQADRVDEWVQAAQNAGIKRPPIHMPSLDAFGAACPPGAVHQGVGVQAEPLPEIDLEDILRETPPDAPLVFVMLDQVTDPHNFGAILRSACAFGAVAVLVQRRNAPELTALVAKIACGAVDHIPVVTETNLSRAIEKVKEHHISVMGLDERGDHVIGDVKHTGRIMIVLGAEGEGLRRLVRDHCDHLVRLPTKEPIASLNVSNAAAVALYALL